MAWSSYYYIFSLISYDYYIRVSSFCIKVPSHKSKSWSGWYFSSFFSSWVLFFKLFFKSLISALGIGVTDSWSAWTCVIFKQLFQFYRSVVCFSRFALIWYLFNLKINRIYFRSTISGSPVYESIVQLIIFLILK